MFRMESLILVSSTVESLGRESSSNSGFLRLGVHSVEHEWNKISGVVWVLDTKGFFSLSRRRRATKDGIEKICDLASITLNTTFLNVKENCLM